jgi:hypothetical protein
MRTWSTFGVVLSLAILGASSTLAQIAPPPPDHLQVAPKNYRAEVRREARASMFDDTSVRNPRIAPPVYSNMGAGYRWVVCFSYNGKNSYGGFTGNQEYMAVYVSGRFSSIDRPKEGQCRSAQYSAFPELARK